MTNINNENNNEKMTNRDRKDAINYNKLGISTFYKDIKYGISIFKEVVKKEKCFEEFNIDEEILETINIESSESYSLGFGEDEDISLDEIIDGCININARKALNTIKHLITKIETDKLLDFTVFTIPSMLNTMPYLLYSNKDTLLLGIGLLTINPSEDLVKYNTFLFYNYRNPITNKTPNKLFDLDVFEKYMNLDLFKKSTYKDMTIEDYLEDNIYSLSITEKQLFLNNFVNSEFYTNIYDRTFIDILLGNSQILNKLIFVKSGIFFNNLISYSDFEVKNKDSLCAFKIRCNERRDDKMDSLPRMDALEYLLEHYDRIFIEIPVPTSIVDIMESKLYKNKRNELESNEN